MDPNIPIQPPAPVQPSFPAELVQPTPQMPPVEPAPVAPPPPTKKTNWVLILGIVLLLISVLALVGYYLYQSNQSRVNVSTPTPNVTVAPTPTATTNPTADWKTYNNSTYKYSIQYPSTWTTQNVAAGAGTMEALPNSEMMQIFEKNQPSDFKFEGITIQALQAPTLPQQTVTINNIKMFVFDDLEGNVYYAKVPNQNVYLEITGAGGSTINDTKNQTIRQIFSTFKFTT